MSLTKNDLQAIRQLIDEKQFKISDEDFKKFNEHIEVILDQKIEEKQLVKLSNINHLPSKEEFYNSQDKILGELQKLREEVEIVNHQYIRTNKRVDIHDKHLNINTSNLP